MIINFQNVSFRYVDKYILNNVTFSFDDNSKIGLMGVNGIGKSTILKLIAGKEKSQDGNIIISGNSKINYLEQTDDFDPNKTIFETVNEKQDKEHPSTDYEIKAILNNLKLSNYDSKCGTLSGGEKKRLALAICLISYCDFLLLDEPTNHLDNDSIIWLEKYLMKWKKGLLLVTHDRYFLERICNKMFELDNGKIYTYEANYSTYLQLKEERLLNQAHVEQKVKSFLRNELVWIRAGAQARSTKQKGRIQRFEEASKIEFTHESKMEMISMGRRLGGNTIEIEHISKSIEGKTLFNDFSLSLLRSARIAIVGDNGCGKTTLFKIIMGKIKPDTGDIKIGETVKIGYFSQDSEQMDPELRVIDYIKEESTVIKTLDGDISAKKMLEMFLFDGDKQYSKIKTLSGGEKRRLQLLRVIMTNPNVLIFDEPTNDLDILTIEILEEYLDKFLGPVLVVSHDRYFVDKTCDSLLAYEDGKINPYNLSLSEYLEKDNKTSSNKVEAAPQVKRINISSAKIKNQLEEIEKKMANIQTRIDELNELINSDNLDYVKLNDYCAEKEKLEQENTSLEEKYFENMEILESIKK